jgi:hypothetical protein
VSAATLLLTVYTVLKGKMHGRELSTVIRLSENECRNNITISVLVLKGKMHCRELSTVIRLSDSECCNNNSNSVHCPKGENALSRIEHCNQTL